MDERQTFASLLQDMLEQAQINNNQISQQEIQEFFEDLNLTDEQMNHIYAYLVAHRINVKGYVPSAAMKRESRLYEEPEEKPEEETQPVEEEVSDEGVKKARRKVAAAEKKAEKAAEKKAEKQTENEDEAEPDSAFLKMYLRDMRGMERLTKSQEKELAEELVRLAAEGDMTALEVQKERFVNHKIRYVVQRARKYALGGETLDELVQEGNIGLMMAVQQLDGFTDGAALIAHVEEEIVHTMEQYINETYASGSEEQAMVAKVHFVSEAARTLKEENGQEPTLKEMAAYTNLSEEELLSIINLSADNLKA